MIEQILSTATRRQRRATAIAIGFAVIAASAGVALLALSGWFQTGAAMAGLGGLAAVQAFNYLLPSAGIRGLAIARTLSRYGERFYGHKAALLALADVRPALFARLAGAAPAKAFAQSPGAVATQLGSDVDALEDAVVRRVTGPGALAAGLAGLVAAALAGWLSAFALVAGLACMRLVSSSLAQRVLAVPNRQSSEALNALKSAYADYAPCAADIAVYGLAPQIERAMAPYAAALDQARLAIVRAEAIISGAQLTIAALTTAAVLACAQGGAVLAALAALAAAGASEGWAALSRADMQAARVANALSRLGELAALPARDPGSTDGEGGSLCVAGVSLAPGDRLLIAGASGTGKTRLLGTLIGLRTDAPQAVLLDNQDARTLPLDTLRDHFAYAPQDASLIAGSVTDNLRLARPGVTEEEIWAALRIACLDDVVRALPDGLDQWLGGDGARLSGGQRKRLALARALLANKPWLVLDEPSEGLDGATEARLATQLADWLKATGTGLILVSHRTGLHGLADQRLDLACG